MIFIRDLTMANTRCLKRFAILGQGSIVIGNEFILKTFLDTVTDDLTKKISKVQSWKI